MDKMLAAVTFATRNTDMPPPSTKLCRRCKRIIRAEDAHTKLKLVKTPEVNVSLNTCRLIKTDALLSIHLLRPNTEFADIRVCPCVVDRRMSRDRHRDKARAMYN